MSSSNQAKQALQIARGPAQLSRAAFERSGERPIENSFDRDHLDFLCAHVDSTPKASQLKDDVGAIYLENLGGISF